MLEYTPLITKWELFFDVNTRAYDRVHIVNEIVKFLDDSNMRSLNLDGKVITSGLINGKKSKKLLYIKKLEKNWTNVNKKLIEVMKAEIDEGLGTSVYYMLSDGYSRKVRNRFNDAEEYSSLSRFKHRYVPLRYMLMYEIC